MNEEILKAKQNFPNKEIPKLILQFYSFLTNNKPSGWLDYESIIKGKEYLEDLISKKISSEFIPFFVDSSHAVFSIWVTNKEKNIIDCPIVFMDTEGIYTVCAKNLSDFFYLFSLTLADKISKRFYNNYDNTLIGLPVVDPYKLFDGEKLQKIQSYNIENYTDYELFKSYVDKIMGISNIENPVKLVDNAINNFPLLIEYLRANNGF